MKHRTLAALVCGALLAAIALGGAWTSSSSGAEVDPPQVGMLFSLAVDGQTLTNFAELTGLVSGVDPDDLEQSRTGTPLRLPATRTPPRLVLRRGLTSDRSLADWHEQAMLDSTAARREAILTVFNQTGTPVARYRLEKAWPAKIEVASMSGPSSLALETVTIVAERLTRVEP